MRIKLLIMVLLHINFSFAAIDQKGSKKNFVNPLLNLCIDKILSMIADCITIDKINDLDEDLSIINNIGGLVKNEVIKGSKKDIPIELFAKIADRLTRKKFAEALSLNKMECQFLVPDLYCTAFSSEGSSVYAGCQLDNIRDRGLDEVLIYQIPLLGDKKINFHDVPKEEKLSFVLLSLNQMLKSLENINVREVAQISIKKLSAHPSGRYLLCSIKTVLKNKNKEDLVGIIDLEGAEVCCVVKAHGAITFTPEGNCFIGNTFIDFINNLRMVEDRELLGYQILQATSTSLLCMSRGGRILDPQGGYQYNLIEKTPDGITDKGTYIFEKVSGLYGYHTSCNASGPFYSTYNLRASDDSKKQIFNFIPLGSRQKPKEKFMCFENLGDNYLVRISPNNCTIFGNNGLLAEIIFSMAHRKLGINLHEESGLISMVHDDELSILSWRPLERTIDHEKKIIARLMYLGLLRELLEKSPVTSDACKTADLLSRCYEHPILHALTREGTCLDVKERIKKRLNELRGLESS